MTRPYRRVVLSRVSYVLLVWALGSFALADEAPDLELNPVTGFLESVDIATGAGHRVRHVVDKGQGGGRTSSYASSSAARSPRIAIRSTGESWVVWWEDAATDRVLYARRNPDTGAWTTEAVLSASGEDSQYPEIVHNGSTAWVAYQVASGTSTSIEVRSVIDDPEPIDVIATTTFTGDVDVLVHAESNHVWVTWVDSASYVGWSERQSSAWATAQYQSYAGSTVEAARAAIRATVLGQ